MLLKGVQARLQSMKHRDGAIGLLSLLNQLVNDRFLPSNTLLGDRNVSLGLGKVVLLKGLVHGERPKLALAGQRHPRGGESLMKEGGIEARQSGAGRPPILTEVGHPFQSSPLIHRRHGPRNLAQGQPRRAANRICETGNLVLNP